MELFDNYLDTFKIELCNEKKPRLMDFLPVASEQEVRALNQKLKPEYIERQYYELLNTNNQKQLLALQNNFIPDPYYEIFDNKYDWVKIVNCITSTIYRPRPSRRLRLVIKDKNYDFIYGFVEIASPVINAQISNYFKSKNIKLDYNFANKYIVELSLCIATGELTKLLSCKMLVYMALSKEIITLWDKSFNTEIKYLYTTSLYGKSSVYNRIPNLKFLGYSEGYNSLFDKKQIKWLKDTYKKVFPTRKINISAKADHLIRLYEHLYSKLKDMPFYPIKTRRGVYLAEEFGNIQDNIAFWLKRWYFPRLERLNSLNF